MPNPYTSKNHHQSTPSSSSEDSDSSVRDHETPRYENLFPITRRLNNKTTTLQSPPPSPMQTQPDIESNQNISNAACIRHCGTSCASVLFQSICACIAILGAIWIGFVALSWLEIIGISSLPPGVKYGHKVNDIY
jgi:hypothetical protein